MSRSQIVSAALQTTVAILAKFLQTSKRDQRGTPSDEVCNILLHILEVCRAPFLDSPPSSSLYAAPTEDAIALLPSLPKLIGAANYSADTKEPKKVSDSCLKEFYGHAPITLPWIFHHLKFCHHGVCYSFQMMNTCTVSIPGIFRSWFQTASNVKFYDNACKLHQYCLNREPQFFKQTLFVVHWFHWNIHVGCSSGYSLDTYRLSIDILGVLIVRWMSKLMLAFRGFESN